MVHVAIVGVPGTAALSREGACVIEEVDQRIPSSELRKPHLARFSLNPATENVAVEIDHLLQVVHADDDVVD